MQAETLAKIGPLWLDFQFWRRAGFGLPTAAWGFHDAK